jgi:hypothetical protein
LKALAHMLRDRTGLCDGWSFLQQQGLQLGVRGSVSADERGLEQAARNPEAVPVGLEARGAPKVRGIGCRPTHAWVSEFGVQHRLAQGRVGRHIEQHPDDQLGHQSLMDTDVGGGHDMHVGTFGIVGLALKIKQGHDQRVVQQGRVQRLADGARGDGEHAQGAVCGEGEVPQDLQ